MGVTARSPPIGPRKWPGPSARHAAANRPRVPAVPQRPAHPNGRGPGGGGELAEGEAGPYDTRPCPRDRSPPSRFPAREPATDNPPAISLLESPDRLEASLLAFRRARRAAARRWPGTRWASGSGFRSGARRPPPRRGFAALTPADLPEQARNLPALADVGLVPGNVQAGDEQGAGPLGGGHRARHGAP